MSPVVHLPRAVWVAAISPLGQHFRLLQPKYEAFEDYINKILLYRKYYSRTSPIQYFSFLGKPHWKLNIVIWHNNVRQELGHWKMLSSNYGGSVSSAFSSPSGFTNGDETFCGLTNGLFNIQVIILLISMATKSQHEWVRSRDTGLCTLLYR